MEAELRSCAVVEVKLRSCGGKGAELRSCESLGAMAWLTWLGKLSEGRVAELLGGSAMIAASQNTLLLVCVLEYGTVI